MGGKAMPKEQQKQLKRDLYKKHWVSGFDIMKHCLVPIWKKSEELKFLADCPAQVLVQKINDLNVAISRWTKGISNFPNFKQKRSVQGFRWVQDVKVSDEKIYLPKIGWIKFFSSREIVGKIKNVTVSSDNLDNWYVSILVEQDNKVELREGSSIGVDLGVTHFAALSDESFIVPKNAYTQSMRKLKILERSVDRKKKGSNNRKKAVKKLAKTHKKISDIRKDFLHKNSTLLSKNHATIVVEDLKVSNMSKSAAGTVEKPGANVAAKSGLNRSILDQGWSEFRRQLKYKQEWSGGVLIAVDPKHTSQTCNKCNYVDKQNRKDQSRFVCLSCGHTDNADTNAAKNILRAGHVRLACGDIGSKDLSPGILI
jgi:putative transposase